MFHRWIEQELSRIEKGDLVEPEYEMDPKIDHFLGEMSEELKKLFTLWRKTGQATKTARNTATEALKEVILELATRKPSKAEIDEILKKTEQLKIPVYLAEEREGLIRRVFWASVRDEFPRVDGESLVVCKGFKVAWFENEKKSMSRRIGIILPFEI